jgi:hypothetical protein
MTIEIILLILESVLLLATIILLLFSLKEGRGRRNLLLEVGKATKILSRQEYFLGVTDSMMDAEIEVVGVITGRLPSVDDKKRVNEIIHNIEKLKKTGISVKYLMPKFHDRIHIGHLYKKAGAEVRYSICAIANNIRYIIVDDRIVVIGIPESTGEKEATRKGYRIPSEGLAGILKDHFSRCWEGSMNYEDYLREIIRQTGATPGLLANELQIEEKEIERLGKE